MDSTVPDGVVVVGSLTVDLTTVSDRLPSRGETVLGTGFTRVAGGKGANQALAAALMGSPTWMVGRVGEDDLRHIVLETLGAASVRTELIAQTPDLQTGVAHIRVDASGDNDIVMVPLANAALGPRDVDDALAAVDGRARVLLAQLEIPVETAMYAMTAGRRAGMITVLDPAPVPPDGIPDSVYQHIDFITPNETEATLLTGMTVDDPESAAAAGRLLVDRGCAVALMTLGSGGVVIVDQSHQARHVPGYAVHAVDSTAAGDAFTGALGSRLAAGDDTSDAVDWANAAGALATTVLGASTSIPRFRDVQAHIGEFSNEGQAE